MGRGSVAILAAPAAGAFRRRPLLDTGVRPVMPRSRRECAPVECIATAEFAQDRERKESHSQASTSAASSGGGRTVSQRGRKAGSGGGSSSGSTSSTTTTTTTTTTSSSSSRGIGAGNGDPSGAGAGGAGEARWSWQGRSLQEALKACTSPEQLIALLSASEAQLDAGSAAAAFSLAARQGLLPPAAGGWALTREQVEQLAQLAHRFLPAMDPSALAATAWASAALGLEAPELLQAVERRAEAQLVSFRPAELVAVLWALSQRPDHVERPTALLRRFGELVEGGMELQPQWAARDLATLLWCYGKVRCS